MGQTCSHLRTGNFGSHPNTYSAPLSSVWWLVVWRFRKVSHLPYKKPGTPQEPGQTTNPNHQLRVTCPTTLHAWLIFWLISRRVSDICGDAIDLNDTPGETAGESAGDAGYAGIVTDAATLCSKQQYVVLRSLQKGTLNTKNTHHVQRRFNLNQNPRNLSQIPFCICRASCAEEMSSDKCGEITSPK